MQKTFIVIFASILTVINCLAQYPKQLNFEINGTINADTGKVHLYFYTEYTSSEAKTLVATINNNKFTFSGFISEPQGAFIMLDESYMSPKFVIEQGVQTMTVDINNPNKMPELNNKTMLDDHPNYVTFFKAMTSKWDSFYNKNDSMQVVYQYDIPQEINSDLKGEYNQLCSEDNNLLLTFCEKNPSSYFAFWRLVHLTEWGYDPIYDSIFNHFSDALKNGYAGSVLKTKLIKGRLHINN